MPPCFLKAARSLTVALCAAVALSGAAYADKFASIVVDLDTSRVLHARNADQPRYPASLTKVMTLYLVFDRLQTGELSPDQQLPVSKTAASRPRSKLYLKAGSTISTEDAVRALITKSANDAAVVLAEAVAGSEAEFAELMTEKARELGLTDTVFKNASGLPDPDQVSTARDLAKLAEAIFRDHRDRYDLFSTTAFTWRNRSYENHNRLLLDVPGVDGIKTGYTSASGYNLMASAERDGRRVVAIMLGGVSSGSRDEHVSDLIEAAFLSIGVHTRSAPPELRQRIETAELAHYSADQLAALQLRKLTGEEVTTDEPDFLDDVETAQGDADPTASGDVASGAVEGQPSGSPADQN